jgi:molybdenum cofactor cytidylyltransferase
VIAAVVPAAGRSERMGRPKLILPIDGRPVISRVVSALRLGGVEMVVVIAPPPEAEETEAIVAAARSAGAIVESPISRPPDMRASFEAGLCTIEALATPISVLLAPGDSPGLSATVVEHLIRESAARPGKILVPMVSRRRGHPLLLPWATALTVRNLPSAMGVNALLASSTNVVEYVETTDDGVLADLDTPDDYRAWEPEAP